ncbi:MAG: hypothetical protein EUB_02231 [Eubacterium sp.]|uniref:hypothetical protein n=1 Tax=Eubacterium sp. TaxID=142586 RepID=UPI00302B2365
MLISQGYASAKISELILDLVRKLENEFPLLTYQREVIADGEAFIVCHEERFICVKIANGIELSTWQYMWGRKIEEVSYRIDCPSDTSELDYILWMISLLCEVLLKKPYASFFVSLFDKVKEAR